MRSYAVRPRDWKWPSNTGSFVKHVHRINPSLKKKGIEITEEDIRQARAQSRCPLNHRAIRRGEGVHRGRIRETKAQDTHDRDDDRDDRRAREEATRPRHGLAVMN